MDFYMRERFVIEMIFHFITIYKVSLWNKTKYRSKWANMRIKNIFPQIFKELYTMLQHVELEQCRINYYTKIFSGTFYIRFLTHAYALCDITHRKPA